MNKLIAVVLSISLIFGSVTPSLAQVVNDLMKNGVKAVKNSGKNIGTGAVKLPPTVTMAAGNAAASNAAKQAELAGKTKTRPVSRVNYRATATQANRFTRPTATQAPNFSARLQANISAQVQANKTAPKSLKEIRAMLARKDFSQKDAEAVYKQIFNVSSRTSSAKEYLLLNTFPEVAVNRGFAVSAQNVALATDFYRRTLLSNLQGAPSASLTMEEIVSLSPKSAQFAPVDKWAKSMAAVTDLGFYGSSKDISLLLKAYQYAPEALKPVTEVVVGRALLNLQAYDALNQFAQSVSSTNEVTSEFWQGVSAYAQKEGQHVAVPAAGRTIAPFKIPQHLQNSLAAWCELNVRHADPSAEETARWASLAQKKGKVIAEPTAQPAAAVRQPAQAAAQPLAPKVELDLNNVQLADNLSVGAVQVPASGVEESAPAAVETQAPAQGSWLSRGLNRIKNLFSSSKKAEVAEAPAAASLDQALSQALGLQGSGTLSVNGLGGLTQKVNNKKVLKRALKTLDLAKNKTDTDFIAAAKKAQSEGRSLTSADYDQMLSDHYAAAVAADPVLAPHAQAITAALEEPTQAPAKRELSFSLKLHDEEGKVLPVTFELNVRLLDNTAVKQFERLGITNSEVFTLMRAVKDGKQTGPFELMLATPGGSKRPIYEPFIEGGKAGAEALYYRLLGDYQAGKLASKKVDLNFYSDVYAERATMFAGLTEGLGGLPQATVAPQATALGISDPKSLQEGVSHSQLGNVASVFFSGLQKEFGIKNTLALGLGIASVGLAICGFGLSLPAMAAKIAMLGLGSFVLGVGANGGVKSTNSIFAKEMSNDNTSGTARMGFVNARASVGTMTGYLFFPVSVLFALSGVEAFQWLYYGAMAVPAYALFNLLKSKVKNVGASHSTGTTLFDKVKVAANSVKGILKNIGNNIKFVVTGGYSERAAALREKRIVNQRVKEYHDMLKNGDFSTPLQTTEDLQASKSLWGKVKNFFSVKVPAATSQYLLRMMLLVGLYHFAGMMYNSGPGAIIGNFIKSPEGAAIVDWAQNLPMPITALLAGGAGFVLSKLGQKVYSSLRKKMARGSRNEELEAVQATTTDKVKNFVQKNFPYIAGGLTTIATAVSPELYEVAHSIFSRFDPTSVAQLATFFTAYVGVWAGRQYLSQFVKSGKLSPQGIIGASGVLSTLSVGLAFLPFLPLGAKAALWAVAGLGFANLAGFENSLAMEKYPNQKPAVNMAYTLARLSGALTVLYGSLANMFSSMGVADPEVNALVLPAGALALATLINGKYFTHNFIQDIKRWRGLPPTLNYKLLRSEADTFFKKYQESGHSVQYWEQDANRIATDLFNKTRHELTTIERLMKPLNEKLRLNQLRLDVIEELKKLLNGAAQNNMPLSAEELTYKTFRTREIQPLLVNLSGKRLTAEQEAQIVRSVAEVINNRYFITASELDEMANGVKERNEGLDQFRLEVLRNMYKMQLTRIATDRVQRYKGNRPSYDRAMDELKDMANKVLGSKNDWQAPAFEE